MTRHEQLIAYLATLAALLIVFITALVVSAAAPGIVGKIEAFGLGTITGGLIGVLRLPQSRLVAVEGAPGDSTQAREERP